MANYKEVNEWGVRGTREVPAAMNTGGGNTVPSTGTVGVLVLDYQTK